MSTWPSVLSTFSDPTPTNRLNSPSHSSVEGDQNDALEKLEAFIGTSSSAVGTLMYNIRAAASDGGGHVQGVDKGGTGQTSYTKGDIIVATSASAVAKLAVGSDNQMLRANSSTASGINWAVSPATKVFAQNNNVDIQSVTSGATSIGAQTFTTTIDGSTLGTSNAIRAISFIRPWVAESTSVLAIWKYGGNIVASVALIPIEAGSIVGRLTHTIVASTVSVQRHTIEVDLATVAAANSPNIGPEMTFSVGSPSSVINRIYGQVYSTSSIESSANQTYSGHIRIVTGNGTYMSVVGTIVEKIVP